MRHSLITSDLSVEHVFRPAELFQMIGSCERVSLPLGFVSEVNEAQTLTGLLDTATNWTRDILKADRVSIALLDENDMMRIWALRGRTASRSDKSLPRNYGRLSRVIDDHVLIISPHLAHCSEPDGIMLHKSGLNRTINAPLIFNGDCIGTLNMVVVDSASIGVTDAVLMQTIANWIAPALASFNRVCVSSKNIEQERARASRAQSESAMKSSFIANVSHEIRTPLNAMIGMAQILGNDDLSDAQAEKVKVILHSGQSLITTLNDILDLSKIEAGKLTLTPLRNHPAVCFAQTVDLWRDRASQKSLTITLSLSEDLPETLVYDAARVQQCVSNLLSNAIKFSERGVIDVLVTTRTQAEHELIKVTVSDPGCGIAPDALASIFEPFEQAKSPVAGNEKGTGLGLAICRRLARMMDGEVSAQSVVGQGSAFSLTFLARQAPALDPTAFQTPSSVDVTPSFSIDRPLKLLLVEDVATNRLVVRLLLTKYNFEVLEAEHGRAALDHLHREPVDLVLLDMQMPVMDGEETIQHIRNSDTPFQTVPVIALTASAMVGDRERFLQMGIDGYVPKPVEANSLLSEINEIMAPRLS